MCNLNADTHCEGGVRGAFWLTDKPTPALPKTRDFYYVLDREAVLSSVQFGHKLVSSVQRPSEGEIMKEVVCAVLVTLLCLSASSMAKESPPKVQVYSRAPGEVGKANTLICHVSGFHPPQITIELLENGKEIKEAQQSDLAFGEDWHYHLTKHVPFTPNKEQTFSCRVSHMGDTKNYIWEPDM